jgi:hypothetical protein
LQDVTVYEENEITRKLQTILFRKLTSLHLQDVTVYEENVIEFTKKIVEITNEFCKIIKYQIHEQDNCISMYWQ